MRVARVSRSRAAVAHRIARGAREPLATCAVGNGRRWQRPPALVRWQRGAGKTPGDFASRPADIERRQDVERWQKAIPPSGRSC